MKPSRDQVAWVGALSLIVGLMCRMSDPAMAARPFVTDDARLTQAGSCQIESWSRIYRSTTEFWALPACNPTGGFELTFGAGRAFYNGFATNDYIIQGKTLFRALEAGGFGWGIAAGKIAHPAINPGPNLFGNHYFYIPFSVASLDSKQVLHLNLGALRNRSGGDSRGTWGLGLELNQTDRLQWIAEAFGDHTSQPYLQAGARYAIQRNLLQIDMTVGGQPNGPVSSRWLSLGLRYTPDDILRLR